MPDSRSSASAAQSPHGILLSGLLLLFLFRVVAQLIQALAPVSFLPPFETWQSGALPYPALVAFQVVILAVCTHVVRGVLSGRVGRSSKMGKRLVVVGWIYLIAMAIRLLVGLTIAPAHFWFGAIVPTLFHLVLAAFVLVWGSFHRAEKSHSGVLEAKGSL